MNSDCDDPLSLHSDTVSSEIEAVSDDILDNNDKADSDILDDVVDSVEEDPAKQQLLSRLSEEHQQEECPSVSTRINFGIQEYKEPETHITIENSMRRVLNLGNEKEKKRRRKPAKQTIDKGYAGMENTRRTVPKETNHRLNRNIKKSDAIDGLRKPFRDINLENEKVPEISPSGIKLNNLTSDSTKTGFSLQNLSKSTSSGTGLNLNSLAQQHLNSSNQGPDNRPGLNLSSLTLAAPKVGSGLSLGSPATGPGLSLSSLAQNHLTEKTSSPGLSLTSLANHHLSEQPNNKSSLSLSNNSLSSGLGGLGLKGGLPSSNSGLSGLAQLHLQDQGASTAKKSGFTIPSLFGSAPPPSTPSVPPLASSVTPVKLPTPSPPRIKTPEAAIDLSSALRSLSSYDREKSPEPLTAFSPGKTQILVEDLNMSTECSIRKRKCSPLGEVVVRRWSRRKMMEPQVVVVVEPSQVLEGFKFDVPSPDEAVLLAQTKAFNRPSLASSAISRNTLGKAAVK